MSNLLASAKFICATKLKAPFSFEGHNKPSGRSGEPPNLDAPTAISSSFLACTSILMAFLASGDKSLKSSSSPRSLQPLEIFAISIFSSLTSINVYMILLTMQTTKQISGNIASFNKMFA